MDQNTNYMMQIEKIINVLVKALHFWTDTYINYVFVQLHQTVDISFNRPSEIAKNLNAIS